MQVISLYILGLVFGWWWFSVIALPLFYGIPRTLFLSYKGALSYRSVFFYLTSLAFWFVFFTIFGFVILFISPSLFEYLLNSRPFFIGQWIGIIFSLFFVLSKRGRDTLRADLHDITNKYKKGPDGNTDINFSSFVPDNTEKTADFLFNAADVFIILDKYDAWLAAIFAARFVSERQRNSLIQRLDSYSKDIENLRHTIPHKKHLVEPVDERIGELYTVLANKHYETHAAGVEKDLRKENEAYLNALANSDADIFKREYPDLFSNPSIAYQVVSKD